MYRIGQPDSRSISTAVSGCARIVPLSFLVLFTWLLGSPGSSNAQDDRPQQQIASEYTIKVVFVYRFSMYVSSEKPVHPKHIVIGVLGKDPFGNKLDRVAKAKKPKGKQIKIKRFAKAKDYQPCDILFIPRGTAAEEVAAIVEKTGDDPVLIVGEHNGFIQQGGVINFYINDQGKVAMQLNVDNMKKRNLRVDARLMKLCEPVSNKNKKHP